MLPSIRTQGNRPSRTNRYSFDLEIPILVGRTALEPRRFDRHLKSRPLTVDVTETGARYAPPNQLFLGSGQGLFSNVTAEAGPGLEVIKSQSR